MRTGFVKVSQKRPGGEHVLNYVGPGGYFGEIGLLSDVPEIRALAPPGVRTATCTALDHVDLVRITAADFRDILAQFPDGCAGRSIRGGHRAPGTRTARRCQRSQQSCRWASSSARGS